MTLLRQHWRIIVGLWSGLSLIFIGIAAAESGAGEGVRIAHLPPDPRGGHAYRMTYHVPLPMELFWRFKTDFDNQFLEDNKYILKHRMISRRGNIVVTEDVYSSSPSERFHWQTRIVAKERRLEFKLLDTKAHNHKFHYGVIELQAVGKTTRVIQTAYFDFLGASIWAIYPWGGGMQAFLEYSAKWERETAVRLRRHYIDQSPESDAPSEKMRESTTTP